MDPRDPRAFGYNYITTDNRIQFWAIKTERTAATTVLAFRELFELAVERLKNSGKTEEQVNQTTSVPASPEDISVSIQVKINKISNFICKTFFSEITD
jgi:hypothetical protein